LCPHASLQDKDNLEEAVRKQHDLIEKQSDELKALRRQLEERDGELTRAK
jgi:formate hydrogenlyase subunit 6/NADH:ubiquinone oxidoreductase subunit I